MSTPLTFLHRRSGAQLASYRGIETAATYGDGAAEDAALRQGCGLVDLGWCGRLEMAGEDRARFLHGYVTCDVKALASGAGAYGFVTNVKGRVLADLKILALDDRLWLEVPRGVATEIAEHLQKYVIVDRVEIRPADEAVPFGLIGPRSAEVLAGVGDLPEVDFGHRPATIAGVDAHLVREPSLGEAPGWTLWVPTGKAEGFVERLLDHGAAHGLRLVGHRALDRLRVAAGRPLFGVDFGPDNFPQETGLEEVAVSYEKGCYLGQEVVARIHYRGGVNRHLRGLAFDADAPDAERPADLLGRQILADGREAGTVTSAAESAAGWLGLAILHRRAEPGAGVGLDGGGTARVVELPFSQGS